MKKNRTNKQSHTSNTKNKKGAFHGDWHVANTSMGMGDYYGTGVRAKLGKMREGMGMVEMTPKKLKTPPRSVA